MPRPRGRSVPLSLSRRMVGDFLHASRRGAFVTFERVMPLAAVREARDDRPARPPWPVLFAKALGLAAGRCPELRQSCLRWPRPRIYEHFETVASVVVEKEIGGADFLFALPLSNPAGASVGQLAELVRRAKHLPADRTRAVRRSLRYSRLPLPARRALWGLLEWSGRWRAEFIGTCGVSATAGWGAAAVNLVTPWATALCYAPFRDDGTLPVRLTFDHRVLDGSDACRILAEVEAALTGPVLRELSAAVGTTTGKVGTA
jgi:hypothetical protein